jgi:hypothetical protein
MVKHQNSWKSLVLKHYIYVWCLFEWFLYENWRLEIGVKDSQQTTAHLVHKTIHEAYTSHNKVLANAINNVMKEVFFGMLVDQVGLAYSNGLNPSTVGSNIPGSS